MELTKINTDYYSFFLFSRLYGVFYETNVTPYDELYEEIMTMYQDYVHSEFNDEYKPEYECMVDFLKNNLSKNN